MSVLFHVENLLQLTPASLPDMSDTARKRTLADWVVKTKKQVVKLYAIVKWSRDADTVQKCMVNIFFDIVLYQTLLKTVSEYHCISYGPKPSV